jgi:transcriptional regulator with XRE-family HTH domain
MKYNTGAAFFQERSPEDVERFIKKNFDISEQVTYLLEQRGWTQKDLAQAVGKSESEISRWLTGMHNLTLRSIAKMEAALGADIILSAMNAEKQFGETKYVYLKVTVPVSKSFPDDAVTYDHSEFSSEELARPSNLRVA